MNIKHLIFEEEEEPKKPTKAITVGQTGQPTHGPSTLNLDVKVSGQTVVRDANRNVAYSKLLEKTSFENTSVGVTLTKYLDPLKGLQIDEHAKYKAALAQAQAQEGLTVDKVLACFEGLKVALKNEVDHFEETATSMSKEQINDKASRQQAIKSQLESLQREWDQLAVEVHSAQSKIDIARRQFQDAVDLRTTELDQQKAHYAGLLQ
jgi:hypothetical protein